jgi:hypothetical protein
MCYIWVSSFWVNSRALFGALCSVVSAPFVCSLPSFASQRAWIRPVIRFPCLVSTSRFNFWSYRACVGFSRWYFSPSSGLHRTKIFVSFSRAAVAGSASAFFTVPALTLASSFSWDFQCPCLGRSSVSGFDLSTSGLDFPQLFSIHRSLPDFLHRCLVPAPGLGPPAGWFQLAACAEDCAQVDFSAAQWEPLISCRCFNFSTGAWSPCLNCPWPPAGCVRHSDFPCSRLAGQKSSYSTASCVCFCSNELRQLASHADLCSTTTVVPLVGDTIFLLFALQYGLWCLLFSNGGASIFVLHSRSQAWRQGLNFHRFLRLVVCELLQERHWIKRLVFLVWIVLTLCYLVHTLKVFSEIFVRT